MKDSKGGKKKGTATKRSGREAAQRRAASSRGDEKPKAAGDKGQWFRKAYEDSPIAIELYDAGGRLMEVNRACLELFGIEDEKEIKGFNLFEDPNVSPRVKKRLLAGETVRYEAPFDFRKVKKLGRYRTRKSGVAHFDVLITPLRLGRKTISGYLVQILDITKRTKAEEALRKASVELEGKVAERTAELAREVTERRRAEAEISTVYNAITDMITVQDTDYRILSYNKVVEETFGTGLEGRLCYEAYQSRTEICPDCAVKKAIETGKPAYTFQVPTLPAPPVEIYAYPILDEQGRVTAVVEHGRDVTEKIGMHAERERLLHAVSASSEGIAIADEQDRYIFVNEAHARIYGRRPEELLGKTWRELTPPEILEQTETAVRMTLHNPEVGEFHGEFPAPRKDGSTIPTEVRGRALRDEKGNYQGHICIVSDIAARKEAEEAIRHAKARAEDEQAKTEAIISAMGDGIGIQDRNFTVVYQNEVQKKIKGDKVGQFCYRAYENRDDVCEDCPVALCFEDGGIHAAVKSVLTDRGLRHMEITASPLRDSTGEIIAGIEIVHDITTRKEAEEALKEREERFRKVFEEGPLGMAFLNLEGKFTKANSVFCGMMGYSEQELQGMTVRDISHPERVELDRELTRQLISGEIPFIKVEKQYVRKGGEVFWGSVTASIIRDDAGKPLYTLAMVEDITERKRAEEALRQSEKFLHALIDSVADPIMVIGSDYRVKLMNRVARELSGVGEDLPEAPLCHRLSHHSDAPCSEAGGHCPMAEVQNSGRPATVVHVHHAHNGEARYVEIIASPLIGPDGAFAGIIESSRDITDRKRAEELLKQSETKYRNLVELTSDIIYLSDSRGNQRFMNDAAYKLLEAEPEEIIGQPWDRWIHPEDRERTVRMFRQMVEEGTDVFNFENRYVSKSGKVFNVLHNVRVLRNDEGEIVGTQGIARDITERKKAEESLRLFSEALEEAPDGVQIVGLDGLIVHSNKAIREIFGYHPEETIGRHVNMMSVDTEFASRVVIPALQKTGRWAGEVMVRRKDGSVFPVWLTASMVTNSRGELIAMVGVSRDITERRKMEDALKGLNAQLSALIEAIPDAVMFKDPRGRHLLLNRACEQMFHFNKEDILGKTVEECMPPAVANHCRRLDDEAAEAPAPVRSEELVGVGPEKIYLDTIKSPIRDENGGLVGLVSVSRDITERKRMEEALRKSLEEKEMLIKEVHHRVKNNLALVTSLLNLQSRAVEDEGAKRLFIESTNRVRAMSAIHEQLYRSGDPSGIDFKDYASRLVKDVVSSFERHPGVGVELDIAEVKLDMDTVVPCALIINELVTNAFKHAFPDGRTGRMSVSFQPAGDGAFVLSVRDDGKGFPEGLDFRRATSMGMQIVTALVQQLGGDIDLLRDGGTEFRITFPMSPNRKTPGGK